VSTATAETDPGVPRQVKFIRARFEGKCWWCNEPVPTGSSAVYYVDERAIAHDSCHREVCT